MKFFQLLITKHVCTDRSKKEVPWVHCLYTFSGKCLVPKVAKNPHFTFITIYARFSYFQPYNDRTITGVFSDPVHQRCNLNYKIDKHNYKLPFIFNNLCGCDAHLIFQKVQQKHCKITLHYILQCLKYLHSMGLRRT